MTFYRGATFRILPLLVLISAALSASPQSGNAGAVRGTVTDPSGAVVPNATRPHLQRDQRIRAEHGHRCHRPICIPQRAFQPLPHRRFRHRLCSVEPKYRDQLVGGNKPQAGSASLRGEPNRYS